MKSESGLSIWKCSQCEKKFKYESEKRRHEQSHAPQFKCKVCSKKFSFLSALRRHEKQHERKGSVSCSDCSKKFRDETLLKRHMQYAHKGTYKCTTCPSTFHSETALSTHMKIHKPLSEWKFHCSFKGCSKKFNFAHHLKHHELTHTNVKPHVCKDCGKSFIQPHHLKVHQRLHKPDTWIHCVEPDCDKRFTNEYALKRHIATHRKKSLVSNTEPDVNNFVREKDAMPNFASDDQTQEDAISVIRCTPEGLILTVEPLPYDTENVLGSVDDIVQNFTTPLMGDNANVNSTVNELLVNVTFKNYETSNLAVNDTYNDIDNSTLAVKEESLISNCQTILGKCIVTGDSEVNENCLCAQMDDSLYVDKESTTSLPINNNNNRKLSVGENFMEKRRRNTNACETCECASTCDLMDKVAKNESPEFEYRKDGVIKIKDTFDIDFAVPNDADKRNAFTAEECFDLNMKYAPISSCKDVIGTCIVSGNGTMGDGCLCARMTAEDQQAIEQEMDEITPQPRITWSS